MRNDLATFCSDIVINSDVYCIAVHSYRCVIKVPKGGFHSDAIEEPVLVPQSTFQ